MVNLWSNFLPSQNGRLKSFLENTKKLYSLIKIWNNECLQRQFP